MKLFVMYFSPVISSFPIFPISKHSSYYLSPPRLQVSGFTKLRTSHSDILFHLLRLFNDAGNSSFCQSQMLEYFENSEIKRKQKENFMPRFELISRCLYGGSQKNDERPHLRLSMFQRAYNLEFPELPLLFLCK